MKTQRELPTIEEQANEAAIELESFSSIDLEESFLDACATAYYNNPDAIREAIEEALDLCADGLDYTEQIEEIGEPIVRAFILAAYRSRFLACPA